MNTQSSSKNLKFTIENIAPIRKLTHEFSNNEKQKQNQNQNIIYAPNGTGKSFLARAFRMLDEKGHQKIREKHTGKDGVIDEASIVKNLLSQEVFGNGHGKFEITLGNDTIGSLDLDGMSNKYTRTVHLNYLVHVFSSDYISQELHNFDDLPDKNSEQQIIIGSENEEIIKRETALAALREAEKDSRTSLETIFNNEKASLKSDFDIGNLAEFNTLSLESLLADDHSPSISPQTIAEQKLQTQKTAYENVKAIPDAPDKPFTDAIRLHAVGAEYLNTIHDFLKKPISPSSVAESYKAIIAQDEEFYKKGIALPHDETCPFCTQSLNEQAQNAIDAYLAYFADEEAKAKQTIKDRIRTLDKDNGVINTLRKFAITYHGEVNKYNALAQKLETRLKQPKPPAVETTVEDLCAAYQKVIEALNQKEGDLASNNLTLEAITPKIKQYTEKLDAIIAQAKAAFDELNKLLNKLGNEKTNIRKEACQCFPEVFFYKQASAISKLLEQRKEYKALSEEIQNLKNEIGAKASVRAKIAATFSTLLKEIIGDRYSFDPDNFILKYNDMNLQRSGNDTFSDGEKSMIAFCYYLAQSHMKAATLEDYKKIFYVIDDPVSSLSFDAIYRVANAIKKLRICKKDGIVFTYEGGEKPHLLILTHHDYLYNLFVTNKIIASSCRLEREETQHNVHPHKEFLNPFYEHLEHVYSVSQDEEKARYWSACSIRFVLESIWRFCYPNLNDLTAFVEKVNKELNTGDTLNNVLINDGAHGSFGKALFSKDLHNAASATIKIVKKYAEGQLHKLGKP